MNSYTRRLKGRIITAGYQLQEIARMISDKGEHCTPSLLSQALHGGVTPKSARIIEVLVTILDDKDKGAKRAKKKT